MAAILHTNGPVSTHNAAGRVRPFLSCLTSSQFLKAGRELEAANLGSMVNLSQSGRAAVVFVKKVPEEAVPGLLANPDLCTPELYAEKYFRPTPACITWKHRASLVSMGYVSEKHFMGTKKR